MVGWERVHRHDRWHAMRPDAVDLLAQVGGAFVDLVGRALGALAQAATST
jgi:hypothetical protein